MKPRSGTIVALLLLATCNEDTEERNSTNIESGKLALGVVPPTEVAAWRKVGSSSTPDGRYLQAAAFDETRKVVVMFGGTNTNPNTGTVAPNQETWEWSLATGKWTNRTGTGSAPNARSGAAMVFDSLRGKFVLFGGRAGSGSNFEDTWEWDPATGAWTNVSAAGSYPSARSQHGMVYEKSTGKILLFGGGRSDQYSSDGSGVSISLGDTWEYDPVAYKWTLQTVATAPSVRHDFGLVWDSARNKAVLFAGLQTDIASAPGVPKQDTWEWDPATATWTERTAPGNKPSQRYGHAMAFDGSRNKVVVFGGWDISTGNTLNDLWDWEPTTGAWTQRLTGSESGIPSARMYASMVADVAGARLELVAGAAAYNPYGTGGTYGSGGSTGYLPGVPIGVGYGATGSREVWELNPATPAFTDRTPPLDVPSSRYYQAMAYYPLTGKTYIFGGYDAMTGQVLDELWAWDGKTWAQVAANVRPPARSDAGLAYDPARKSLILYGGNDNYSGTAFGDTWEWTSAGTWVQLSPASSPDPLMGHGMVTDTARNKILLFGGMSGYMWLGTGAYVDPIRNEVWEWDGLTMTWTNRTPPASVSAPSAREYPLLAYEEGRQKMFLYDGTNYGSDATLFWEWDPLSAGWTTRSTADALGYGYALALGYDSIRRREVLLTDPNNSSSGVQQTWEVESKGPTWYVRALATTPGAVYGATTAFDGARGVVVLFGGQTTSSGSLGSETWEYSVTNLGNGEGCTATFATSCASGNCVDGVCCDVAACTGACKSCNVAGSEGTCVLAKAGTEVTGSCAVGQACDGTGSCLSKNGQACTVASACASGFCADGVCCDSACAGTCASCNQAGRAGKCSPYPAGTDPQSECGGGSGVCKSTCDGTGTCAYPGGTVSCGTCYSCDGMGTCSNYDYNCGSYGGSGGSYSGSGGRPYPSGGAGGGVPILGGAGGRIPNLGGAAGGIPNLGGAAGGIPNLGGSAGSIPNVGGSAGGIPNVGGAAGSVPSYGGSIGAPDAGAGDAGSAAKLNHSGCSCELGKGQPARPVLAAPFLIAGVALLLRRRRRRDNP
jgi:MYXO-CTERM domain-containing protein